MTGQTGVGLGVRLGMAGEDRQYTEWVRARSCCAPVRCGARHSEAHHRQGAGLALKAHDHEAMPLCVTHHRELHAMSGCFRQWDKARRKAWEREQVAICRAQYLNEGRVWS